MENIVGFGLLVFCGYMGYSADSYTTQTYVQLLISGLGGGYLLVSKNLDKLKTLFKKRASVVTDAVIENEDKLQKDVDCLDYLLTRCQESGSPESVDMIVQINTILFKSRVK